MRFVLDKNYSSFRRGQSAFNNIMVRYTPTPPRFCLKKTQFSAIFFFLVCLIHIAL